MMLLIMTRLTVAVCHRVRQLPTSRQTTPQSPSPLREQASQLPLHLSSYSASQIWRVGMRDEWWNQDLQCKLNFGAAALQQAWDSTQHKILIHRTIVQWLYLVDTSSLDDVAVSMTSKHLACCLSQQSSIQTSTVFDARAFDKHECCSSSECCDSFGMCSAVNWK